MSVRANDPRGIDPPRNAARGQTGGGFLLCFVVGRNPTLPRANERSALSRRRWRGPGSGVNDRAVLMADSCVGQTSSHGAYEGFCFLFPLLPICWVVSFDAAWPFAECPVGCFGAEPRTGLKVRERENVRCVHFLEEGASAVKRLGYNPL